MIRRQVDRLPRAASTSSATRVRATGDGDLASGPARPVRRLPFAGPASGDRGPASSKNTPRMSSAHWNEIARKKNVSPRLWRDFSDLVHSDLLEQWLAPSGYLRTLKTDLFDEAMGTRGLVQDLVERSEQVYGIDLSGEIVDSVRPRFPLLEASMGDVRALAFPSDHFDLVVSNSTLDHFENEGDILASLVERHRVTRPGGTCLVTMDNFANPLIRLRQALPFKPLHRLGVLPYYVGHTVSPGGLVTALVKAGFQVDAQTCIMHVPRLPAVWLCRVVEWVGLPALKSATLSFLFAFEKLKLWPTSHLSGYFSVCLASKSTPSV